MNRPTSRFLFAILVTLMIVVIGRLAWQGDARDSDVALTRDVAKASASDLETPFDQGKLPAASGSSSTDDGVESARMEGAGEMVDSQRVEATFSPTEDLQVEVVDLAGRAIAGLPLTISASQPPYEREEVEKLGLPFAITNDEGRATLSGGRIRVLNDGASKPRFLWHLVAFEELPRLELTEAAFARELVRSVQPPYGAIEVHVSELDDRPATKLARIELEMLLRSEAEVPGRSDSRPSFATTVIEKGIGYFPFAEPGRDWLAAAVRAQTDFTSRGGGAGPAVPGTSARFDIQMGWDRPVVQMRLLSERGPELADMSIEVAILSDFEAREAREYRTDERGIVRVELAGEFIKFLPPRLSLQARASEGGLLRAIVGPLRELKDGLNEIGDVVLIPDQLCVAGRVVDERGLPVRGATVAFGAHVDYELDDHNRRFGSNDRQETQSAEAGRFEIHGTPWEGKRYVWAIHEALPMTGTEETGPAFAEAVELRTFGQQVELVLRETRRPSVSLIIPSDLKSSSGLDQLKNELRLSVFRSGDPEGELNQNMTARSKNTITHYFERVAIGRFDVTCHLGDQLIDEARGVLLEEDGHLASFDFSRVLYVHRLRLIESSSDESPLEGNYRVRPSGKGEFGRADHSWNGNLVEVLSFASAVDIHLLPNEYRDLLVEDLSGEREVQLLPPLRVRLVLVTDGPIPAAPYVFNPVPKFEGRPIGSAVDGHPWFTATKREVVFLIPTAGKVMIAWHLEKRLDNGAIGGDTLHGHRVDIDVQDIAGEQRFELHVPAAVMKELVEEPPF